MIKNRRQKVQYFITLLAQSLMSNQIQSKEDQLYHKQEQAKQKQEKQQSNEPAKTKQINKGRPKKKRPQEEEIPQKQIIDWKQCLYNRTVLNIQGHFIEFFEGIDERKGFIYCRQFREKLKKNCSSSTTWTQQQTWDPVDQMAKLNAILPPDELQNNDLKKLMLQVSSLHASEFTNQFYDIFLKLYTILKDSKSRSHESQIKTLADSISKNEDNKYIFFSREFRKHVKQTKKFPFKTLESNEPYVNLLLRLANDIKLFLL